jgi:RimJ/RimL family protein N-acetyltransferase
VVIGRFETQRLVLRPLTLDDVDPLVALDSDPEVMRYITGGRPTPRTEMIERVRRRIGRRWIADDRATAEFVGWFGLVPSAIAAGEYEVGYRLRRAAWGKGLATEGTRALIDLAFTELGATRIWAETMAVNARSRAVMERCGLRYARTFHVEFNDPIDGTELGEVEYELLRSAWETGPSSGSAPA